MGKEVHAYAPAYADEEIDEILSYVDHIVFNSFPQWKKFKEKVKNVSSKNIECGIRINPEYSEIETATLRSMLSTFKTRSYVG